MNFCFTRVIILYSLVEADNKVLSISKKKKKNKSEKERLEQIVHQGEAGKHLNGFKSQPPGGLKLDALKYPAATGSHRNIHCRPHQGLCDSHHRWGGGGRGAQNGTSTRKAIGPSLLQLNTHSPFHLAFSV